MEGEAAFPDRFRGEAGRVELLLGRTERDAARAHHRVECPAARWAQGRMQGERARGATPRPARDLRYEQLTGARVRGLVRRPALIQEERQHAAVPWHVV